MNSQLKALGLALVAVFAMTAVLASGAQAQIKVTTAPSPTQWLTGAQVAEHTFTIENGGPVLSCEEATFASTVTNGATSVTVVPFYGTCHAIIGTETFKATVTMNDCDYLLHGGVEETSTTFKEGEVDVKCPAGKAIEIHLYKKTDESEELCTVSVVEQLNKKGNEFHDVAGEAGKPAHVTLTSNVTVNITRTGSLLCGKATNTAIYNGTTTLKAFEDDGGSISNGTVSGLVEGAQTAMLISFEEGQIKVTTAPSPTQWLTGAQVAEHTFTIENGGPVLSCEEATFASTVTNGATSVTVVPFYGTCHAIIGTETFKATVTMNDCDYLLHGGVEETSTTFKEGEVDVKCPAGKAIEIHLYKKTDESEELCTVSVVEQLNKKGNEFHDVAGEAGKPAHVTLTSNVTVNITRTGSLLCGKATNTAIYNGTTTLKAFEDDGGSISNGTVSGLVEGAQTAMLISFEEGQIKVTTAPSPTQWLTGAQVAEHTFTIENGGPVLSCEEATFASTVTNGATSVTVVPFYGTCHAIIGTETFKATVTMNDCDYLLHGGVEETSTTFKEGEVDVKCPAGKAIEIHLYKKTDESEELCTVSVVEQLNKKGNEFHDVAGEAGKPAHVTLTSNVTVNITRTGSLLCGKATNTAIYNGTTTLKAFEDDGGSISNGTVSGLVEGAQVSLTASK